MVTCEIALWLPQNAFDDKSVLYHGLLPFGKNPLLEQMLTQIYITVWLHQASMSYNRFMTKGIKK